MKIALAVIAVAFVALAGAGLWFAAERHYDSCVRAPEAANPVVAVKMGSSGSEQDNPFLPEGQSEPTERVTGLAARREAVEACTRVPF